MIPYTVYVTVWWYGILIIQYLGKSLSVVWWCTPWLRTDTSGGCCGHGNESPWNVRNFLTSKQLLKDSRTWNYYVLWNLRDLPLFYDICCLFLNAWKVLQTVWPYAVTGNRAFQKTGVKHKGVPDNNYFYNILSFQKDCMWQRVEVTSELSELSYIHQLCYTSTSRNVG